MPFYDWSRSPGGHLCGPFAFPVSSSLCVPLSLSAKFLRRSCLQLELTVRGDHYKELFPYYKTAPTPYLPGESEFSGKGDRKHRVVHKDFITIPQTRGCTGPKLCFILSSPHFARSQTVLHNAHWMDGQERQRWGRQEVPRIISQQPGIKN